MTFSAAATGVVAAVARSIGLPCTALAAVFLAAGLAGGHDLGATLWLAPLVFLALGVVHELGHVTAIHLLGGRVLSVGSAGRRHVHVRHGALSRPRDALCVAAGPVAPLCVLAVLVAVALVAAVPGAVLAPVAVVAVGHLCSLVVPVGDGAQLRAILRETALT
jgi:hypothetical protein